MSVTKKRKIIQSGPSKSPQKKKKIENQEEVQGNEDWTSFSSDLTHPEVKSLQTTLSSIPWDALLFLVDLDQTTVPIGPFLHWLLFADTLPTSIIVIVCKSSFVQLECTSCHTKFGKMKPLANRILGKRLPLLALNLSVLDFYCFCVSKFVSYRYKFVLLTNNEDRANGIIKELDKQAKTGYHLSITSLNLMDKGSIISLPYLPNFVTEPYLEHINDLENSKKPELFTSAEDFKNPSEFKFQDHTLDTLKEHTLSSVVTHVRDWIGNFQKGINSGHLPKTRHKLENSLRRLCSWKYSASPSHVMHNLHQAGLIRFCENCESLYYPERDKITISPPTSNSTILSLITEKAKEWIHTQPGLPSSSTAFRNQIISIKIPHSTEPSQVVETLIEKKIVCPVIPVKKENDSFFSIYSYGFGVEENVEYALVEDEK